VLLPITNAMRFSAAACDIAMASVHAKLKTSTAGRKPDFPTQPIAKNLYLQLSENRNGPHAH
jgi:hypothetical protein